MLVVPVEGIPIQQALQVIFLGMKFCFVQSYKFFLLLHTFSLNELDAFEIPKAPSTIYFGTTEPRMKLCFVQSLDFLLLSTFELNHFNVSNNIL